MSTPVAANPSSNPTAGPSQPAPSAHGSPKPRLMSATVLATLYGIAYVAWVNLGVGTGQASQAAQIVSDLAFLPLNVLAGTLLLFASRNPTLDSRIRRALGFAAAAEICIGLGNLLWFYFAVIRGVEPTVSVATLCYLAYYPLTLCALRSFPIAEREQDEWWKFLFDAAIVAVSGTIVVWYVSGVTTGPAGDGPLGTAAMLSYPVSDLIVLLGLATLLLRRPIGGNRSAFTLLCLSEFIGILADLAYTLVYPAIGFRNVAWTDGIYVISYVLLILAGELYLRRAEPAPNTSEEHQALERVQLVSPIPYVAVAAALGLLLFVVLQQASGPIVVISFGVVAITVLVAARQVVAVRQNARLLAHHAAAESDRRYRLLFDNNPLPMWVADAETFGFIEVNDAALRHYGYTREEFTAMTAFDINVVSRSYAAPRGGAPATLSGAATLQRHRTKDGSIRDVETVSHPIEFAGRAALLVLAQDVTERRRAEAAVEESKSLLKATLESTADGILVVDRNGRVLTWNRKLCDMWGIAGQLLSDGDAAPVFEHLFRAVRHPDEFRLTVQQLTADPAGECLSTIELADKRVFERYTQPQRLGGLAAGRIWSFRDVSERASAERALRGSEARFRSVFDHAAVGIALIDDEDMIVDTNRAFQSMLGYEAAELRGRPVQELLLADDTVAAPLPFESVRRGQGESATVETRQRHRDGRILWVSVTLSRVEATDSSHRRIVCMTHDITERKELEAQLTHQAFHDALTNLANRALFRDRVERALARQNRGHAEVSVLYVDLDNFKTANDTYGHSQGDALLVATAGRLLNATRGSDTVARIGGDEFAILLEHVHDRQEALIVAQRVEAAMKTPFELGGKSITAAASIGIASTPADGGADELLRNADVAMYRAKILGKGRIEIFRPEMHAALVDKLELEAELLQAVERQEFTLVYQPIVELDEARIIGFEALLRWIHPTRGVIPPLQFIPLAEQTGVIIPLGRWVLAEACRQGAAWQRTEYGRRAALTMTINISGWQLDHPTFIDDVRTALQSSGLPANNLVLEITESAIIRDYEHVTSRFQALKAIGVRLAIDDFGTGYSSLAYLHRFPVDILKIDKTFVDGVGRGGRDAALARTIIALGDMLSLRTVAEGIEQAEQRSQLQSLGCGLGQGYYFAKPLSAADAEALLSADGEGLLHQAGLNAALTDG